MQKVVIGCLSVVVLFCIGVGVAGYVFVFKPAATFVGDATRFVSEMETQNARVRNTRPYSPPTGAELAPDQLQRFLAAQADMQSALAERVDVLVVKYEEIEAGMAGREPNLGEVYGLYRDIADLLLLAKRSQVDALNRHDFSLEEYAWVREQTYLAIDQPVAVMSLEQLGAAASVQAVSDGVRGLVEPYRERLMEMHALAWFGL